jgi:hypothetical protein
MTKESSHFIRVLQPYKKGERTFLITNDFNQQMQGNSKGWYIKNL